MPIIKSAIKAAKQNVTSRIRNNRVRRTLHDVQKDFTDLVKDNKVKEAEAMLPNVYKVIDTAAKKNVIPANRAARLKSKAAKLLASVTSAK